LFFFCRNTKFSWCWLPGLKPLALHPLSSNLQRPARCSCKVPRGCDRRWLFSLRFFITRFVYHSQAKSLGLNRDPFLEILEQPGPLHTGRSNSDFGFWNAHLAGAAPVSASIW
jgi:hypothetical protein